jgi:hypothetical protein
MYRSVVHGAIRHSSIVVARFFVNVSMTMSRLARKLDASENCVLSGESRASNHAAIAALKRCATQKQNQKHAPCKSEIKKGCALQKRNQSRLSQSRVTARQHQQHVRRILETQLETKLYGARPMRIERVEERCPGNAIGSAALESGGIRGAGIATDDVVSGAAGVIGIVDSELRVIENVESLGPELELAGLANLEMLEQRHVEVRAARIIQEVASGVAKGEAARSDKLGRIADEGAKTLGIVAGRRQSPSSRRDRMRQHRVRWKLRRCR